MAILCGVNILLFVAMKLFFIMRNKQKRRQLDGMDPEQRRLLEGTFFYAH